MHTWKRVSQLENTRCSRPLAIVIGLLATTATACSSTIPTTKNDADPTVRARPAYFRTAKWPLKFREHSFTTVCYSTRRCGVWYAGVWSGHRKPSRPSSEYGPNYLDHIMGGHIGIANFPGPADLTWLSADGTEHQARIDIGAIFRDQVIRHNVPRGEVAPLRDGELSTDPLILLEINDRTIRIYMRATIPTKHYQVTGNPYSAYRNELVLARTYNF